MQNRRDKMDDRFNHDWSHTYKDTVSGPAGFEVNALVMFPAAVCHLVPGMADLLLIVIWVAADIIIRNKGYTVLSFARRLRVKLTVSKIMGGKNRIKGRR
ncbi:hypothetical protein [Cellvibrio sp. NN19]|uniref:hypothetical protein n=1 Tax=Cellvibrio chitinivorans TaxID=3102792 RepID=UPI002B40F298|nr:hypothetical protein [Cellvibrio sp. NN19]